MRSPSCLPERGAVAGEVRPRGQAPALNGSLRPRAWLAELGGRGCWSLHRERLEALEENVTGVLMLFETLFN